MTSVVDQTRWIYGYRFRHMETGMMHGFVRWPNGRPPSPSGCRWCGCSSYYHGSTWMLGRGYHGYERPTDAQILARMKARRRARGCRCHLPFVDPYRCEADVCMAADFLAAGGPLMAAIGWTQTPPATAALRERREDHFGRRAAFTTTTTSGGTR